jgi:hypothetical protein
MSIPVLASLYNFFLNTLKRTEDCDTYLTQICIVSKNHSEDIKTKSFKPTLWLSLAVESLSLQLKKATDMSQVSVALFSAF